MAELEVGTSLGQNPFKIQDTFTWGDLSLGHSPAAEQARQGWWINGISAGPEAHFFEVRMNAFEERESLTLVISVMLLPYGYLVYSDTSSLRAARESDLAALAVAYLEGLLGMPLAERIIRRYGGRILEWLESVAAIYSQENLE
jgi:hypothetical protein